MEFYKNDSTTMILGRYQMIKYPTYYLFREKINLSPKITLNKTGAIYTKLVGKTIGK
jgi:hypothetical protein